MRGGEIFRNNRGNSVRNTCFTSSITDQNMLRIERHDLGVVKESPKLKNEYRDQCTRQPNHMEPNCLFLRRYGQGDLWNQKSILLLRCNGLVRPPDISLRFMDVSEESMRLPVLSNKENIVIHPRCF